jgi:hypothetical protein
MRTLHLTVGTPRLRIGLVALAMALLGAWGGIVPYAGPDFGYPLPAGTHQPAWQWTATHWQLYLVAGAATLAAALVLVAATARPKLTGWGTLLGLIGGAWFVLGPVFAPAFLSSFSFASGASTLMTVVTPLGYNDGTGLLIAILAILAFGFARTPSAPAPPEEPETYETAREVDTGTRERTTVPR